MDFIKRHVINNARLKALSLLLAFMLWFATTYLGESHVTMTVPVQLANLSRTCITRTLDTREVLVTLNGPLSLLKNIKPGDINLIIDLSKVREGRQIVTVRKSDIIVPKGIRVEEVRPDYVVFEVDRTVEKYLSVIVKLDLDLSEEYRVLSWSPQHVLVEGPKQLIGDRESIETVPITRELLSHSGNVVEVPLNAKDLCARKVRPETIRVVLRKISK